jgi:hypothetical protein
MSYTSTTLEDLYVLRWGTKPEPADVERYAAEIATASGNRGKPLVALFIMPKDSTPPDELFRKTQAAKLPEIMKHLKFAVAVFEGEGFISSLKRSALVAILLIAPKRYPIHVRATVEEALISRPPGPIEFDARKALVELKRRTLI